MSDITREEFASAVAATISSVHHLYREVTRLIEGLRDALSEEPARLFPCAGVRSASQDLIRLGSWFATHMVLCSNRLCLTRRLMRRKTTRRNLTPMLMMAARVGLAGPWNSWPICHYWRSGWSYTTRASKTE